VQRLVAARPAAVPRAHVDVEEDRRLELRQPQVVECRFFGGMDEQGNAAALGVSERTVHRDWAKACAWLYRYCYPEPTV